MRHDGPRGRVRALACLLLFGAYGAGLATGYTITAFEPSFWPRSDSELGVAGFEIEDFEDAPLVAGLQIQITTPEAEYGPLSTLHYVFDPATDPYGSAFVGGVWDGARALVNTATNQSAPYDSVGSWGSVTFLFAEGVLSFGISIQQALLPAPLYVNDVPVGDVIQRLPPNGAGRNGYLRIDAEPGKVLFSVRVENAWYPDYAYTDGIAFDHLAIRALPEPATLVGLAVGRVVSFRRRA